MKKRKTAYYIEVEGMFYNKKQGWIEDEYVNFNSCQWSTQQCFRTMRKAVYILNQIYALGLTARLVRLDKDGSLKTWNDKNFFNDRVYYRFNWSECLEGV